MGGMATMLASIDNRLTGLESRTMLLWMSVAGMWATTMLAVLAGLFFK